MIHTKYVKKKAEAALKLLGGSTLSLTSLEAVSSLIRGISDSTDQALEEAIQAFKNYQLQYKGLVIEKTSDEESLKRGESSEKKVARQRCIYTWNTLFDELEGITSDLNTHGQYVHPLAVELYRIGRALKTARKPVGVATLFGVIILLTIFIFRRPGEPVNAPAGSVHGTATRMIQFENTYISVDELVIETSKDCHIHGTPAPYYRAKNGTAAATLDGTRISEPDTCGYGMVEKTTLVEGQ